MRPAHTLTLTLLLVGTLPGCAGIGKQDFACPGQPSRPLCLSTSEVYRLSDDDRLPQLRPRPLSGPDAPRIQDAPFLETPR
jgi:hypothetical protein